MPRSLARLSASAPSHRDLSLAVFITNIAESDFRYTHLPVNARKSIFQNSILYRAANSVGSPVCIENLIRCDCVTESHNISANGRADILLAERGCLALQVEEPA